MGCLEECLVVGIDSLWFSPMGVFLYLGLTYTQQDAFCISCFCRK